MFAIIRTGGKQYRVEKGDTIVVEKLEAQSGDKITLNDVLMLGGDKAPKMGAPTVKGASVAAEVVEDVRGPKLVVFKKKRRKNHRRKNGHRQDLVKLKITDIKAA